MIRTCTGPGLQSWSSTSIIIDMGRGTKTGGSKKCRKFTNLVNIRKIRAVVSTTLPGAYCALWRKPSSDSDVTDGLVASPRTRLVQYCLRGLAGVALLVLAHGAAHAQRTEPVTQQVWLGETGTASYYGRAHQGRRTASGERFEQKALTAAHAWLPFGTKVRVTLLGTSRSVVVTITDRLYSARRVIDLSVAAAQFLGMMRQGIAKVSLAPA
jgi:rare lipoprotein A